MRAQNQSWYTFIASESSEPVIIHIYSKRELRTSHHTHLQQARTQNQSWYTYSKWELRTSHERQTLCSSMLWPPVWSQGVRLCRRCLGPLHGHRQSGWDLHWVSGLLSLPLDQHIKVYETPTLWLKALNNINQEKWQHIRVCTMFKKFWGLENVRKWHFLAKVLGKFEHFITRINILTAERRFGKSGW